MAPVTATVDKSAPDAKLGLSIKRSANGSTRIGRVSEEGLFAKTDLKEGMRVLSINGTDVIGMELNDILSVLKNASGSVTIVADVEDDVVAPAAAAAVAPERKSIAQKQGSLRKASSEHTATVTRASPDQKLGISLKRDPVNNKTLVGRVNPEGLFADTPLKEGMVVVSINNVLANDVSLTDLLAVLTDAKGPITVLARDADADVPAPAPKGSLRKLFGGSDPAAPAPQGKLVTAVVNKENADSKLGISMKRLPGSDVTLVGKINPEGPFASTDLKEGMKVLKVNDMDCADMELTSLLSMLKESTGNITILAEDSAAPAMVKTASKAAVVAPTPIPPARITAVVDKESADTKLGISIRRTSVTNTTMVGRVDENGPFAASGLKEGMRVVTIKAGDQDCTDMELDEMLEVLKSSSGEVVVVAEPYLPTASPPLPRSASFKPLPKPEGSGHSIIFKKTFKSKGMGKGTKVQTFSFHGQGINTNLIDVVNRHLGSINYCATANPLKFVKDGMGHYIVEMNHDCQKYHEEDALASVFDALEVLGWGFRYQYASQYQTSSTSFTSRDIFIFAKLIEI